MFPKQDVFMQHRCPLQRRSPYKAKISMSCVFTPLQPQGMLVKCGKFFEELTVQVWLLYYPLNPRYCPLCKWEGITDEQNDKETNRQMDDPSTKCPRWTFQAGLKKGM